jgi:hypothetical protein
MDKKNASPEMQGSGDGMDLQGYVRLRTLLDSLECGAINYFLRHTEGRGGRFDELNEKLMPLIHWVWHKDMEKPPYPEGGREGEEGDEPIVCPEGYVDCQGVCVPYPCPN